MKKHLNFRHGMAIFFLCLIVIGIAGFWAQTRFGIYGLAITELIILSFAVVPLIFYKVTFKNVFPIKWPKITHLLGGLLIWFAAYLAVMLIMQLTMYYFPYEFLETSNYMSTLFSSVSFPVAVFIVAIMPAICEEMLHRGLLQHTLKSFGYWQKVGLMGLIFGLFHLDLYRFLPTAILGVAFTIVMIETKNILVPMLMHFINNFIAVYFSFQVTNTMVLTQDQVLMSIGSLFILATVIPFLFLLGMKCMRGRSFKIIKLDKMMVAITLSLIFYLAGSGLMAYTNHSNQPVFITNMSMGINQDSMPHQFIFEVEEPGNYKLNLEMTAEAGLSQVLIHDSNGAVIFDTTAQSLTLSQEIELLQGEYELTVAFLFDETVDEHVPFQFSITIR